MVIYEPFTEDLTIAYSDSGYYISEDGVLYKDAVFPTELNYQFDETEELIPDEDISPEEVIEEIKEVLR